MKKLVLALMALMLVAGGALAEKPVHGPTEIVPWSPAGFSRATGDDCTDPILVTGADIPYVDADQTTCGRMNNYEETEMGFYDGGEDIIYQLTLTEEMVLDFILISDTTYTGIAVFDGCPDSGAMLGHDSGSATDKAINGLTLAAGTYYVMIDTWPAPYCINNFSLTIQEGTPPPPPPANDVCEGAIDLQEQGLTVFEVDMCASATNQYSAPSCTGWASTGPDLTYKIDLAAGESFSACVDDADEAIDFQLYLVTDCGDADLNCLTGSDGGNPECISYEAAESGTYYLIVDTWSTCGGGIGYVTIDAPVSSESTSFDSLKAMYRN